MGNIINTLIDLKGSATVTRTSPIHGLNLGSPERARALSDRVAIILSKEARFYKDKLFPVMKEAMSTVQTSIEVELNKQNYMPITKVFTKPAFASRFLGEFTPKRVTLRDTNIIFPDTIEPHLDDLLISGSDVDPDDKEVKEFLKLKSVKEINKAYIRYIVNYRKPIRTTFRDFGDIDEVFISIALLHLIRRGDGIGKGNLEDYRYLLDMHLINLKAFAALTTQTFIIREKQDALILHKSSKASPQLITLSERGVTNFYNNGGEVETIFGAALFIREFITVKSAMEETVEIKRNWDKFVIKEETILDGKKRLILEEVYKKLKPIFSSTDRLLIHDYDSALKLFLDSKSIGQLMESDSAIEEFALDVVYRDTNARLFIDKYKTSLKTSGISQETALTLSLATLTIKYLMKGMRIEKGE